ncbi:MAG: TMEM43 family protein [Verrucomicrobiota bacterium]
MSQDTFTEFSEESWFSRIKNSLVGILFGLVLIPICTIALFWNEGRAVRTASALGEAQKLAVSVAADPVNPANEGKVVHLTGQVVTDQTLADPEFGVMAKALKLKRNTEMYQWVESSSETSSKNLGGSTTKEKTYTYKKEWRSELVDSSKFRQQQDHVNPTSMRYPGRETVASPVNLGAFALSSSLLGKVQSYAPLPLPAADSLPGAIKGQAKPAGGFLYFGARPDSPIVGDQRVAFQVVTPCTVSLVSKQVGKSFEPFVSKNGNKVEMLVPGEHGAVEMFQQAKKDNSLLTWILRGICIVFMWIGFLLIFKPIQVLADIIPFLGNLVGFGTALLALAFALPLSFITIAVAWIWYRPLLGIALLAVAGGVVYWVIKNRKGNLATTPLASP